MNLVQFKQGIVDLETFLLAWKNDMLNKGYVITISDDAPSTYQQLKRAFENNPKNIMVYRGGNENTIFNYAPNNYLFRAYRDLGHYAHGLNFQFKNEMKLGHIQANEIHDALLPSIGMERANNVRMIVEAEIIGQIEYYQIHRRYIDDQKTYITGYLGVTNE